MELIHQILHGDSSAQLSSLLEEWIARYDRTVRDLQMTVLRHIETLYNNITDSISEAWTKLLRSVEPTYIQILHYIEEIAWHASHEILGESRKIMLVVDTINSFSCCIAALESTPILLRKRAKLTPISESLSMQ